MDALIKIVPVSIVNPVTATCYETRAGGQRQRKKKFPFFEYLSEATIWLKNRE